MNVLKQNFRCVPPPEWVDTENKLIEVLEYLTPVPIIAVDTETTGLDTRKDTVLCFSVSDGRRRFAIPGKFLLRFKKLFDDKELIFHNAKFDKAVLSNSGCVLVGRSIDWDTATLFHWYDQVSSKSLAHIASVIGYWKAPFSEEFGKPEKFVELYNALTPETIYKIADYASWDAFVTYKAFEFLYDQLDRLGLIDLYRKYGRKLDALLFEMEQLGVHVDVPLLMQWKSYYEDMTRQLEQEIIQQAQLLGVSNLNIRSTKQLNHLFYDVLKKQVIKSSNRTGQPSVDSEVIAQWAAEGDTIAQLLLDYRNVFKQYSTYLLPLLECADSEGRVHTSFGYTETYRLTSSKPNLQNIPRDDAILPALTKQGISFRKVFSAPKGKIILDADYDQAEICVAANLSKDPVLLDALQRGLDVHSLTASKLFGRPYEEFVAAKKAENPSSEQLELIALRTKAKTINFQILYGVTPEGLAKRLNCSTEEATELINKFYEQYSGVKECFANFTKNMFELGFVRTVLGRIRRASGIFSNDSGVIEHLVRVSQNTPIQGSVADIMMRAMVMLHEDSDLRNAGVRIVLQIHDELLFEAPEDIDPKYLKRISAIMTEASADVLQIPLSVDCKAGINWQEAKGG